jgi:methyl-accepting chemotaxis protein
LFSLLSCGDQDALGAFQQRPSLGWGTAQQVQDPTYAAGKFLDQAIPMAAVNPGWSPDQIAAGVQGAALSTLYAQRLDWANQLIQQAAQATGKATQSSSQAAQSSSQAAQSSSQAAQSGSGTAQSGSETAQSITKATQATSNVAQTTVEAAPTV